MVLLPCIVMFFLACSRGTIGGTIGVNWGRATAQRLLPSMVVDLLLQNDIKAAKVFTSQEDILEAFVGSGIDLTISAFKFQELSSYEIVKKWVDKKAPFFTAANIRMVHIGAGFLRYPMATKPDIHNGVTVTEWVQKAINEAGYGDYTKVSIPQPSHTIFNENYTKPSEAEFNDEIKEEMTRYIHHLKANNIPFAIEMYPITYVREKNMPPEFAFLDNQSEYAVNDVNGTVYRNAIEYMYDSFVWALRKAGASELNITISNIGWPTDGYPGANVSMAERFYKSFLPWVANNKGTPMHRGPINVFIHSLADENKMPYTYPADRHWGIYTSYGAPKYKMDLSGLGRDIYPTRAKGIMSMPDRWCVFQGNMTTDRIKVSKHFDEVCKKADCTSLMPGASCSHLTYEQNVSYAFNMYFQSMFQAENACDFEGLGKVVTENPLSVESESRLGCVFPVEVVKSSEVRIGFNVGNGSKPIVCKWFLCFVNFLCCVFLLWEFVWSSKDIL